MKGQQALKTDRTSASKSDRGEGLPCELCGGTGFVRLPPSERYPNGPMAFCRCMSTRINHRRIRRLMAESGLTPTVLCAWSFDTFYPHRAVGDRAQQAALAGIKKAVIAYANDPHGWLVLCGALGCGKTHLAYAAAAHRLKAGHPAYVSNVPDLLDTLRRGYHQTAHDDFDRRFAAIREVEFLVLDDLGTEAATAWPAEKLYQIIDYRYRNQLPLLVTTNVNLYDPQGKLAPRIASRLLDSADTAGGLCQLHLIRTGDYRRAGRRAEA